MRRLAVLAAALAAVPAGMPAAAQSQICVAVVVDWRELADRAPTTYCAKVPEGSTGSDVLSRMKPQYRGDGLICSIGGLPREGCGAVDSTHHWAYYYRLAGETGWRYSNKGPATRRPKDTESDGWVWMNGGGAGSRSPAAVPYATVCPPEPKPTVAPPPPPAPRPTTAAPRPGTSRTAEPSTSRARTSAPTTRPAAVATSPAAAAPTALSVASDPPIPVATDDTLPIATGDEPGSGGFPLGTAGGLALVAGVGAAALVRRRRA